MSDTFKWNENLMVPHDAKGMQGHEWRPTYNVKNEIFNAEMKFDFISRGRSSAKLHMTNILTNLEYEMFLTDLEEILKTANIKNGILKGLFVFSKRGSNFGVKYIGPIAHKFPSES